MSPPSPNICDGIRGHHHKRGGCFSPIMRARSWPPTSSWYRRSPSGCFLSSSSWHTTVDGSSTWRLPSIRQRPGRHNNFATRSQTTRRPSIYCTIAIRSLRLAITLAGMNIQAVRTAPHSPWQNAYVERVIGSIRRECLDHVIVLNREGLHRVLTDYIAYYLRSRTHLALGKDAPVTRPVSPLPGRTHCRHHRSRRSTPPLRPHRRIAVAQRRSQLPPGPNHLCVEHFCVAVRYYGRSHPRTHRVRARRGITGLWRGRHAAVSTSR